MSNDAILAAAIAILARRRGARTASGPGQHAAGERHEESAPQCVKAGSPRAKNVAGSSRSAGSRTRQCGAATSSASCNGAAGAIGTGHCEERQGEDVLIAW